MINFIVSPPRKRRGVEERARNVKEAALVIVRRGRISAGEQRKGRKDFCRRFGADKVQPQKLQ